MTTVSISAIVDGVTSFERGAALHGLPAGSSRWLAPWHFRLSRSLLIDLWDEGNPILVELAQLFADYVTRHELHNLDDAVAYFLSAPSIDRADHLFFEADFF